MDNWLAANLEYADGTTQRFGPDERSDGDVARSIEFDTQNPGGFANASIVLPRPANLAADDAKLFSHLNIYGPGGQIAYEGRIDGIPQVGVNEVSLKLEGWSAHLDDDETFREIYVDRDLSRWTGPSVQRKIDLLGASVDVEDPSIVADQTTGQPSLQTSITGAWDRSHRCEAFYDSGGLDIASLYGAWKKGALISEADTNWVWHMGLGDDDVLTNLQSGGDLRAAGPGTSTLTATAAGRKFALLLLAYGAAGGTNSRVYPVWWTMLAIYGAHGLTKRGSESATEAYGFYGSDILADVISRAAPELAYTLGESIESSSLVIPHFAPTERTTARAIVEQLTALGGAALYPNDWGVYENREFYWRSPGSYGRTWRVRRDQAATPTSEGPDSKSRVSALMVTYSDGAGKSHSVGPVGSGAEYETADLSDADVTNPASQISRRWAHEKIGITSQSGAVLIGQMLLAERNRLVRRGSVSVTGDVMDEAGNKYPSWLVRAGDQMVVEDDTITSPYPVAATSYNHDNMTLKADIGAPPNRIDVLLGHLALAIGSN